MLLNGEAIFGAVDFSGEPRPLMQYAEQFTLRAGALGAKANYQISGHVVLGSVHSATTVKTESALKLDNGVFALAAGHLWDRRETVGRLESEPNRSLFLAEGYQAKKVKFLEYLDGTFAAALWDEPEQRLILICDRRADAHLYFRVIGDRIIFSSWLRLLYEPPFELDRQAVKEFLRFMYIAPPRTIYKGIARVQGGYYLSASRGQVSTTICGVDTDANISGAADVGSDLVLARFQDLFERAVRRSLGRGSVGVFLSSGIDSATLTVACQKINPGHVQAFTVCFDDPQLDESEGARDFASQIGVPHTELRFDLPQYRYAFDQMAREYDQPYGDPAGLAFVLACQALRDRVDVFGDGSGSDTLFGTPIPRHLWFALTVSAKIPPILRRFLNLSLTSLPFAALSSYAGLFDFDDVEELFITWAGWSKRELQELLGEKINFIESGFYRSFRTHPYADPQRLYDSLGVFPPEDCRLETTAAAHLPLGMPFYDTELVTYVRNLPQRYRISNGITKILLRQLFHRYLPESELLTKKHYFNMPLQPLLAMNNFGIVREYLARDKLKCHGLVDSEVAERWIARYLAGDQSLLFKVWSLLVLHAWLDSRN